ITNKYRVSSFNVQPTRRITDEPFLELSNLDAKRRYYWRVRPFNSYETCTEFSTVDSFRTGERLDTTQLEQIEAFKIFPNPVQAQNTLTLELKTQRNFTANVSVYDIVGRLVLQLETSISPNEERVDLDIKNLSKGVYTIAVVTEEQEVVERFIVGD
ncbi:MAG: T9SS type A sorting domain-containing protein, partial [Bacteroidota bacterium]